MEQVTVNPLLLEVARGLDRDVLERRLDLRLVSEKQRLIAALRALKSAGFARTTIEDELRWHPTGKAIRSMDLDEFELDRKRQATALQPRFNFLFEIPTLWLQPDDDLAKAYRSELKPKMICNFWRYVGTVVADLADENIQLIGPETKGGLMFVTLSKEAREQYGDDVFHFSLGSRADDEPVAIHIKRPTILDGMEQIVELLIEWK